MNNFKRTKSGALVNNDPSATLAYKKKREKTNQLETTINTLNSRISELEVLIQQLIRGQHASS